MSGFSYLPLGVSPPEAAPPETPGEDFGGLAGLGFFTSLTGLLLGAVGSFYSAKGQQGQLEAQASSADFAASMAQLNARAAENDAQAILEAGQREKLGLALRSGQERAAVQVEQAASGTQSGSGSNAEALASLRFMQQLDAMTMDSNMLRAANAARTQAVDLRNQSRLARVSAANLRGTARSIDPYLGSTASLLGGAGTLASQWLYNQRYTRKY